MVIGLLQNGMVEHFYNSGRNLQTHFVTKTRILIKQFVMKRENIKLILTQQALRHYRMECISFWTEFIKLLYSNKMTNMVLIQLLQNGLG